MIIQSKNFGASRALRRGIHEPVWNFGNHIHQFCEYVFVLDGELSMTVEGVEYSVRAGEAIVVLPYQVHSFHTPERVRIWLCVFPNELITPMIPYEQLSTPRSSAKFTPSAELVAYLESVDFITAESIWWDDGIEDGLLHSIRSSLYLIYTEYYLSTKAVSGVKKDNALSRILTYMSLHYTEDLTLASVGEALGYSPKYVSNCFDGLENMSFRFMLNSLRVEHARRLLATTDQGVLSVAHESGFSSETTFHRVFLSIVGMTPAKYREEQRRTVK